jgi:hypothetical protein
MREGSPNRVVSENSQMSLEQSLNDEYIAIGGTST